MSFQVRGPAWPVVALTTLAVVFVLGLQVSTQGSARGRIVRVNGMEAAEGEVLLKYRDDRIGANHAAIETAADAETVEALDRRGMRRMRSRRLRTAELLSLLAQDPDVEYVEPNYVVRLEATPNDPLFSSLWGLFNNGLNPIGGGGVSGADIDAPGAWDLATGSRANVVAIFDTGMDYTHPDLAANVWSASTAFSVTVGGVSVVCAAGTHGFNAITRTCDPMDDQYHGTHVAGTIGADGNNGVGVTGVNWATSMMAIKFLGSSGSGYTSDAVVGLQFVAQVKQKLGSNANVRVLSNSWGGGGYSQSLVNAINAANADGMLFVAAAGNSNTNNDVAPHYPSSYATPNMVAVASSTSSDLRSGFSSYGATSVHLAAPGSAILSTVPGNSYNVLHGTSMATPHVSGAAMLALSRCALSTAQLKSLLLDTADPVAAFSGITTTGGRLNARAALQACQPTVMGLTLTPNAASPRGLGTTVTWTALADGGQAPHEFRFFVFDGTAWSVGQDWSTQNTFAWTPGSASDSYRVLVHVRSAWNQQSTEMSVSEAYAIKPAVTSVTLTPNLVAPQVPGTTVTWTASATGGQAPYQYRFLVWGGSAWTEMRPWGASNVFTWTPAVATPEYKVAVLVRSAWNTGAADITLAQPFAIRTFASVTLNSNVTGAQALGTTVFFNAVAAGGQAPYQYQWALWDGSSWTILRGWHTANTLNWTPNAANSNYRILVQARSAWNTGTAETIAQQTIPIMPPVSSATLTPNVASPQLLGTTVTFTASAAGGQGPYQYRWWVWNASTWTLLRNWSTSNAFAWTPGMTSTYHVKVQVRSVWNSGTFEREAELQNYQIRVPLTATLTPNLSSPRAAGTTIRWTANASGGGMPYQYQWVLFDGTTWLNLTAWTTSHSSIMTFDWTPMSPGANYRVGVRVRSDGNTGAAETTVIQPFVIQ
jgi:subtilisin family serine protease